MADKPNCIKGATPFDGDLKVFFDLLQIDNNVSLINGLKKYDFTKIICPTIATLVIGEDTEQTLFHLLSKKWTASLIIKAVPNVNEIINGFVEKLHKIIVEDNNSEIINKIKDTTVLGESFLDFKGRKINSWGRWISGELSLDAKETARKNLKNETNEDIKTRLHKMIDIISHIQGQKLETKERSSSTASTASINTVSSSESEHIDAELVKLREEFKALEDNTGSIFNRKPCDEIKELVKSYEERINKLDKKCNGFWHGCSAEEKKDIILLKGKIDTHKNKLIELGCKNKGGKRKTAKKQRKTRKSKKSKRSTRKHK